MSALVTPPDLARTYNPQSYEDAWATVEDYQRVLEYTGRHPNKGSSAVAGALELPRGRVHPWMNGSRPAPVRAIQIAEEHEWLPLATDDAVFPAFNRLVAWIFSRGSITEAEYTPLFSCETAAEQDRFAELCETLGVAYTLARPDSTAKGTEARFTDHRTIIGRLLVLLGAPLGARAATPTLPSYLTPTAGSRSRDDPSPLPADPQPHARAFAETYLANTARYWAWRDGFVIRHPDRAPAYLRRLAGVLEYAHGDAVVEVNPDSLFVPTPLAEDLCPHLREQRAPASDGP